MGRALICVSFMFVACATLGPGKQPPPPVAAYCGCEVVCIERTGEIWARRIPDVPKDKCDRPPPACFTRAIDEHMCGVVAMPPPPEAPAPKDTVL